jgi:hypothetical protein
MILVLLGDAAGDAAAAALVCTCGPPEPQNRSLAPIHKNIDTTGMRAMEQPPPREEEPSSSPGSSRSSSSRRAQARRSVPPFAAPVLLLPLLLLVVAGIGEAFMLAPVGSLSSSRWVQHRPPQSQPATSVRVWAAPKNETGAWQQRDFSIYCQLASPTGKGGELPFLNRKMAIPLMKKTLI